MRRAPELAAGQQPTKTQARELSDMAEQTTTDDTQQRPEGEPVRGDVPPRPAPRRPDATARSNLVRGIIERHGGKILVLKTWDERKLAYEIKRQKRGTYIIAYFNAPGDAVAPIERDVKLSEDVLRVMVTDADHLNQKEMEAVEPQPIQPREERNPLGPPVG